MMKKTMASRFKSKNADSSKGRTRNISSNVRPSRKRVQSQFWIMEIVEAFTGL